MSVPDNGATQAQQYAQPDYSGPPSSLLGEEPTTEVLTRTEKLVARAAQPKRPDWTRRIIFASLGAALIGLLVYVGATLPGVLASVSNPTTYSAPRKAPACPNPNRFVESKAPGSNRVCVTSDEYDALVTQAAAQYGDSLRRGKPVYQHWLVAHKLDSVKTEAAREKAAETYICQSDYGDGAYYAATKTGFDENELDVAVGDKIITIDGYDPEDTLCVDGKPGTPPNPPKVEPKDPNQDPSRNGNVNSGGGRNAPPPESSAPSKESPGQPGDLQGP